MPLHKATLSPEIEWVGDEFITHCSRAFLFFFTALHYLAGIMLLVAANWALNGKLVQWGSLGIQWLFSKQWYWIVLGLLVVGVYGIAAGLWMLGELVHMTITHSTRLLVSLVELIEARTPDGTVGILGFLLLLAGFILQMIGTYIGGTN